MSSTIHLASATDARYVPHLAVLIISLAASNVDGALHIHLLHDDTVDRDLQHRLRRLAEGEGIGLTFAQPTPGKSAPLPLGPYAGRFAPVIWHRIWLPEILGGLDRVLYLDADTMVLQDLRPLWETDLGTDLLGAVAQEDGSQEHRVAELGRPLPTPYLNSGVLLMQLDRMRAERLSQRLVDIGLALGDRTDYPDQDAYNLACEGRWRALHPRWNVFASLYFPGSPAADAKTRPTLAEATASPAILHFDGSNFAKPWNARCVHPHRGLYRAYRARTQWPLQLDDTGIQDRVLGRLPVRQQFALNRLQGHVARIRSTRRRHAETR